MANRESVLSYIRDHNQLKGKGPAGIAPQAATQMNKPELLKMCQILGAIASTSDTVNTIRAKLRACAGVSFADDHAYLPTNWRPPASLESELEIAVPNEVQRGSSSNNAYASRGSQANRSDLLPPRFSGVRILSNNTQSSRYSSIHNVHVGHGSRGAGVIVSTESISRGSTSAAPECLINIDNWAKTRIFEAKNLREQAAKADKIVRELLDEVRRLMDEAANSRERADQIEEETCAENMAVMRNGINSRNQQRATSSRNNMR